MKSRRAWVVTAILGGCLAGCPAAEPEGSSGQGESSTGPDGTTTFGPGPGQTATSNQSPDTSATGDGGATDSGGSDGAGFLMMPDGGVVGMCDPFLQDCDRGEKCTSFVMTPGEETVDATKCVPVIGNDVWGEECERMADNDTCAAGFFCMTDVSGHTGPGTCLEYCSPGTPCVFGGECFPFNDGILPVCEVLCDPILQDCPAGQGCYAAFDNFVCAIPGAPEGGGNDGDECNTVQSCNPGLICRGGTAGCPMDGACCTPICEVSGPPEQCTDPSEDCIIALDDPPPGLQDVGYCGVPQ